MFILGIIVGILLSLLVIATTLVYSPAITRTLKQTQSHAQPKGTILEPESTELADWMNSISISK